MSNPTLAPMRFSRGVSRFDNCPEQRSSNSFDEFEKAVISDLSPEKGLSFICSPLQCGIHYQNPEKYPGEATWRLKNYALSRQFLAFDFDGFSSPETFDAVRVFMQRYRGFCYTTATHTEEKPRARVILLVSRPMSRDECEKVSETLEAEIELSVGPGWVKFDSSVYRGEQPIYTPVVGTKTFSFQGKAVEVDTLLNISQRRKTAIQFGGSTVDGDGLLRTAPPREMSARSAELLAAMGGGIGGYDLPDRVDEGDRNSGILAHVGHLRGRGVPEDLIPDMALDFNRSRCSPPLDDDEVLDIVSRYEKQASSPVGNLSPDDWPEPKEIKAALSVVPKFDVDILPNVLKPYVVDASELMQSPPEFIAVPLMVGAAATLGNQWAIAPKAKDLSWKVPPVLWGAIVGRPGTKKSPCMNKALFPLLEIETKLADAHTQRLQKHQSDKLLHDALLKKAQTQAAKTGTVPSLSLPPEEPQPERLMTNDTTVQKLSEILRGSPRGVAVVRDELVGLLEGLDATSQEGARAFYLTAWNGNQPYRVDRIGRGSFVIPRLSVCVLGGMQPGKLQNYVRQATRGGNGDDGLMQRFQLLVWPDVSPDWVDVDRRHDQKAFDDVLAAFTRLRDLTPADVNAKTEIFGDVAYLKFDTQAQAHYNEARKWFEIPVRSGALNSTLEAHFSKYPSMIAALALVIHLVDGGYGPVNLDATKKAVAWAQYLARHAKRAYGAADNSAALSAKALADKITKGALKSGFTVRHFKRKGWQNLTKDDDVRAAMEWLVDANWIVGEDKKSAGRPTTVYTINPKVQG
ncbi:MAG: DUF3987 domain-containing protein [Rhodospirillaceae bacterium]|jgi:hypothetical protein|nr:DUF3987 domain-containing protein [Rhodospirillaceae bacterium]MBT5243395.1 DUF3987 domain-containing protein [Rhodospirillaceae bacterium]MBT5561300.1 DUF3987 domain-containing protein [Rhodospirillaceae bacterium]MBT6243375.1 DUF3987 domain-containing protein [Rhodospirillaceae bacterium]MBT7139005.1 DUF3987 domain-containing protein [Rhodospirillaceae bacterium]